jgi:hypothetical protein
MFGFEGVEIVSIFIMLLFFIVRGIVGASITRNKDRSSIV